MRLETLLDRALCEAMADAHDVTGAPAMVRGTQDPRHGDYQSNGLLPLAKRLGRSPRDLAVPVANKMLEHPAVSQADVAGPGFVNLRIDDRWMGQQLGVLLADHARDGVPPVDRAETIVVDFSGPNVAKPMHVGHLRSTIIGAAIVKLLRFAGHTVIGDNHVGDWGTQFGMLIVGLRRFGDDAAFAADPLAELERVYQLVNEAGKGDAEIAAEARQELAKLQRGDAENRAMWQRFIDATRPSLDAIYARLGVEFDAWLGESFYDQALPGVVEELLAAGIAREDDGAICVFFDDDPQFAKLKTPFIIRKRDGAHLYSTTDLATLKHRLLEMKADRCVYVVDSRQGLHFRQLFATASKMGLDLRLEHVGFGTILGDNNKPLRTREGGTIKLAALLDEAEERAQARIRDEGLQVEAGRVAEVARAVGIGAVKYADLRQNRTSDYRFDWDKLISFKGNAGPYLQYAHARLCSILRKGEVDESTLDGVSIALDHPAERALGLHLLRFGDAVHQAAETCYPHIVAEHLYGLARLQSAFYEHCPVLRAEESARASRLALVSLTRRQLARGLDLLGIEALDRM